MSWPRKEYRLWARPFSGKPGADWKTTMTEKKLDFLLAVHNHQPVGNFRAVFERAFQDCYLPFFEEFRKHSGLKLTVHFSGPLWEYMQNKERTCWNLIGELVHKGQVELLGGGFYEPVLSVIPEEDRQGQLGMMSRFLEREFGAKPRGAWLTERVWEPSLAKTLAKAGLEYTLLDEEHFHYGGITDIHKIYITEDEGFELKLFPIDKKLRYLIPFQNLDELRTYLDSVRSRGGLAILGDDGEKFGLWPGTKKWVYEDGWLARFLGFLESADLQTRTYSEALATFAPGGCVYLPPASYEEMMEWVLEPQAAEIFLRMKAQSPPDARRFLRGGFFREFFMKYREANHLHKRMLFVSRRVRDLGDDEARTELYKAQCNDPYWHGIFGGLYLPHLREDAYAHLLRSEKRLPRESGWREFDLDFDGQPEIIGQGEIFGLVFKPSSGGSLVELDHYPLWRNLTDVLSRRKESYHVQKAAGVHEGKSIHEIAKELPAGAERLFRYDWHPRACCLDHFLDPATTLENFQNIDYREQGDFINQPYEFKVSGTSLSLFRDGHVWIQGERAPLSVEKVILSRVEEILVRYTIQNGSDQTIDVFFGSEWNFYQIPEEWRLDAAGVHLANGKVILEAQPRPEFWHFPLQTLSQSEKGYDIIHQGICLLPNWKITLPGRSIFSAEIRLRERT